MENKRNLTKRELSEDLRICDAATPGPWINVGGSVVEYDSVAQADCGIIAEEFERVKDAYFCAKARTGWPHAIQQAIAAEASLALSISEVERLRYALTALLSRIDSGDLIRRQMSSATDYAIIIAREAIK